METRPRLIDVRVPAQPEGVVLVLHGGASRAGSPAVSPTQPSVLRTLPIARRAARVGRGRLAVYRLLNSVRGWDASQTPVRDAAWALDEIARRLGGTRPACLIGHSLGGRAALLSVGRPEVRSVAALAPWVHASDLPPGLAGQRILVVHGLDDRIASPERSAALARAMGARARVGYVGVAGAKHAMLRPPGLFDRIAAEFASATLLGTTHPGVVDRVMAGERWIEV